MLETTFSLLILAVIILVLVSLFYERKTAIAPVPTLPWVRKTMIKALRNHLNPQDNVQIVELGSGWGGLCFHLSRNFSNATITGFELSPFPFWFSKARAMLSPAPVTFKQKNFLEVDLSSYDVLLCYLSFKHMAWLKDKFETECKPGTIIISNAFPIPGWTPIETLQTNVLLKIPVYVYKVGG